MKLKRFGLLAVLSSTPALSYIRFLAPLGVSVVLLLATPLHAANWYVDNAVANSGSGTSWSSAWKHFSDIVWGSVGAGDTLYISGGSTSQTYNAVTDSTLIIGASGTAGNPITITKGIDAGHNGTVIIDGTPFNSSSSYPIDTNGKHDLTIQNLTAQNSTGADVWIHDSASGLITAQNLVLHTGGNFPITTGATSSSGSTTLNFSSALPPWVGVNMLVMDSSNPAATPDQDSLGNATTPYQVASVSGTAVTLYTALAQNVTATDVIWFAYVDARGFDIRNNAGQVIVQNSTIDTPNKSMSQTDCEYDPVNTGGVIYQYNSCVITNTDPTGHDDCFQQNNEGNLILHGNFCSHPNGGENNHGYYSRDALVGSTWTIDSNVIYMPDGQAAPVTLGMSFDDSSHTWIGQVNFYNNTIYGGSIPITVGNPFQNIKNNIIYAPWGRTAVIINPIQTQYLTTNGTTAIGNNTLNFASGSIPSWVIAGQPISDITASAAIPGGTAVVSKTATTVVMSANAVSPGVGNGDQISFTVNFPPANLDYNLVYGETAGNLKALVCGSNVGGMRGTQSQSSGQWYFEMTLGTNVGGYGGTSSGVGIGNSSATLTAFAGSDNNGTAWFPTTGRQYQNNTWAGPFETATTGDVIGFAVDLTAKKLWEKNLTSGTHFWNNSSTDNPAVGSQSGGYDFSASGPIGALAAGPYLIYQSLNSADSDVLNTGGSSFTGTLPTGFTAWGGTFNPADTGFPASTSICPLYDQINNVYYSWAGAQAAGYNVHGINADPKFTNAAGQDFTLQSSSPAIKAGATIASVPTDRNGVSRPSGSAYDIGAYEYVGTPTPIVILTVSPTSVAPGGSVTATWSNVSSPSVTDWIATYVSGATDSTYVSWVYTNSCTKTAGTTAKASGSCSMTMPTLPGTYELRLFANNGYTKLATSPTVTVAKPSGTIAPTTPTNLAGTAISSSQINLTWTASTDNVAVTGYKIYRSGTQVGTSTTNSFSNTGLAASTVYSYTVSAYDAAGNNSTQSSSISVITLGSSAPTVAVGSRVTTTANLNVRASASPSATKLRTEAVVSAGIVIGGPTTAGGHTWWQVNWNNGISGWSIGDYIVPIAAASSPAVAMITPSSSFQLYRW